MKKVFAFFLCLLCVIAIPAQASSTNTTLTVTLENGLRVVDQIIIEETNVRSSERTATRTKTFYDGDTLIAEISFKATFRFDGSSVSVVSKSVIQTDTYGSWRYTQESFTSSGGTVTLNGKLKYLLFFRSTTFSMSMTCDANGNISY